MDHQTKKKQLQTLVHIVIKISATTDVTIQITEDPSSIQPLNFYDIQNQIVTQLNEHKDSFNGAIKKDKGNQNNAKPSEISNDLIEAFEFRVKREL